MKETWARIEAWLNEHVPSGVGILNPGASEAEMAATERHLGVAFPEDVRASFRLHNGQAGGPWLMWGCELLSLERVRQEWGAWKDLLDRGAFPDFRSDSDGRVVVDWWHARWIPLTYDGGGNHFCLDLNPGPLGQCGQIIQMWHDDSARPVAASSYRDWLKEFADALEAGEYVYSVHHVGLIPPEDTEHQLAPEQAAVDRQQGVEPPAQGVTDDAARAAFRARRRRQIVLLVLGFPFLVVLGFRGFHQWFGGTVAVVLILLTLGYVIFAVIFSLQNWRCPCCNLWLGNQLNPKSWVRCGVRFGP